MRCDSNGILGEEGESGGFLVVKGRRLEYNGAH